MGNQLRAQGYPTTAYHNHTYNYYDRDISHPNMGYDYYGVGSGLEVKASWPESDLEMMEKTIPQALSGERPFHLYYMTVSGHLNYNFTGNAMAYKHREEARAAYPDHSEAFQHTWPATWNWTRPWSMCWSSWKRRGNWRTR